MILLRDFALYVLPALVATGGWLYAVCANRPDAIVRMADAPKARCNPLLVRQDDETTLTR